MFSELSREFAELFTIGSLITLVILTALETVLGFDNLLYISIESKRVAPGEQAKVRRIGTVLAIGLRIVLLFVVLQLITMFQEPWFNVDVPVVHAAVNGHSVIVILGGLFLMKTALTEIRHMMILDSSEGAAAEAPRHRSTAMALVWILVMNIVFSFDTVLSAVALTRNFIVMSLAIIVSGTLMVMLADHVARFLEKNRMYEVLGLFVLLLVGVMLLSEGAHIAHLNLFGYEIRPLEKATFYFVVAALVIVDIVQGRYQKKLDAEKASAGSIANT
jgi:predicted tellurium resistance membrane protein TerC